MQQLLLDSQNHLQVNDVSTDTVQMHASPLTNSPMRDFHCHFRESEVHVLSRCEQQYKGHLSLQSSSMCLFTTLSKANTVIQ